MSNLKLFKVCKVCSEEKPINEFRFNCRSCKTCFYKDRWQKIKTNEEALKKNKEIMKRIYYEKSEERKEKAKEYYKQNREKIIERVKTYYNTHKNDYQIIV